MSNPTHLHKTTIEIWTDYDPVRRGLEIDALAEQAMAGDAYCALQRTIEVPVGRVHQHTAEDPTSMLEFFGVADDQPDDQPDDGGPANGGPANGGPANGGPADGEGGADAGAAAVPVMPVPAQFATDDLTFDFGFDAHDYLDQASDKDLLDLRGCDWGGDYPADQIAYYMEDFDQRFVEALAHCADRAEVGFEVTVDAEAATAWLAAHRPHLLADPVVDDDARA